MYVGKFWRVNNTCLLPLHTQWSVHSWIVRTMWWARWIGSLNYVVRWNLNVLFIKISLQLHCKDLSKRRIVQKEETCNLYESWHKRLLFSQSHQFLNSFSLFISLSLSQSYKSQHSLWWIIHFWYTLLGSLFQGLYLHISSFSINAVSYSSYLCIVMLWTNIWVYLFMFSPFT